MKNYEERGRERGRKREKEGVKKKKRLPDCLSISEGL